MLGHTKYFTLGNYHKIEQPPQLFFFTKCKKRSKIKLCKMNLSLSCTLILGTYSAQELPPISYQTNTHIVSCHTPFKKMGDALQRKKNSKTTKHTTLLRVYGKGRDPLPPKGGWCVGCRGVFCTSHTVPPLHLSSVRFWESV